MTSWRKKLFGKSHHANENNGQMFNNTVKYQRKLISTISQINRTKKTLQRNLDGSDTELHVARLINDIGQLSGNKPLQEINGLIGSLANRHQLASRIFHEYAFDALQESLQKLNDHVQGDCEKTKMVFDEAVSNHCSEHTKKELLTQVQNEWAKHQKLAVKEMKTSLSSYCHIALYNLRLQTAIIEKLQGYVDQLPHDNNNNNDANHGSEQRTSDINVGLPNFTANSIQTRQEIDTMLRIMLDAAPHELPPKKRNKFLDSLSSPEITQTTRNSDCLLRNQSSSNPPVPQHLIIPSNNNHPEIQASYLFSPVSTGYNGQHHQSDVCMDAADDNLPSYTDLFVVPGSCNDNNPVRQSSHLNNR